jgi:Raf kinase inhibitor-like YbhB/YbcL family protein
MIARGLTVVAICGALLAGRLAAAPAEEPKAKPGRGKTHMELTSAAFKAKASIPKKHSCEGEDLSPALSWTGVPPKAQSLAIIMDDPDAPPGTWVHWVLYDLPAQAKGLDEGAAKKETLPNGAKQGLCWGVDEFDRVGYYGPCPPPGKPHRYFFKLYALDKRLDLAARATKDELLKAMKGHVLAQADLVGLYQR